MPTKVDGNPHDHHHRGADRARVAGDRDAVRDQAVVLRRRYRGPTEGRAAALSTAASTRASRTSTRARSSSSTRRGSSCTHWSDVSGMPDAPEHYQQVAWVLTPTGAGTELAISEQNLPSEDAAKTSEQGWQAALQGLKELLER